MIKVKDNNVELRGGMMDMLMEYYALTVAMLEHYPKRAIKEAVDFAMMSEKEKREYVESEKKKTMEKAEKLIQALEGHLQDADDDIFGKMFGDLFDE